MYKKDYRLSSFVMIYTFYEDLWFATDACEELYIYIYIYKVITNEDEPLLSCLTPIFRPHLVVFFRVTKKTVNV